jgi:23S rRNA (uracil1939-C5)-methyltransferase
MDMSAYGAFKQAQLENLLHREGFDPVINPIMISPQRSRRRIGIHARKMGRNVVLGFKARKSWAVTEVIDCIISEPSLISVFAPLRTMAAYLFENNKSAPVLHLTLSLTGIDIDISGVERTKSGGLSADARMNMAMIAAEADFARVTMGDDIIYQARIPSIQLGKATVGLPRGAFLQATKAAESAMQDLVVEAIAGAKKVADLFCGVGTFTFPMAQIASVYAADGAPAAIAALKSGISTLTGLKPIIAEARDLYRRPMLAAEMKGFDVIVFDPPRAGAMAQAQEIADSGVQKVVAISCYPKTLVRDAQILAAKGFKMTKISPIDQFLWSPHIESVALFAR